MAELEATKQPTSSGAAQDNERNLKYLDFVQVAAVYVVVCFSSLYEFAKENSGPLKSGVQTVEGTVKTVIGPVYEKLHGVPLELLKFVDRKVDESMMELNRHVPSLVKQASTHALAAAHCMPQVARAVAAEVQEAGLVDAAAKMYKTVYTKYEPVAEQYAVSVWRSLNRLPVFPEVAQILVPTAAYWSEKYNQAVKCTAERGYPVVQYLPLVPMERISKVFGGEDGPTVSTSGEVDVSSQ